MGKRTMHVDVSVDDIEGLELEQKVKLTVEGRIKGLDSERRFEPVEGEDDIFPPSIELEISSVSISPSANPCEETAEDES